MKKELDKELYPDYVYPEFTPDPNEPFREPIAKLGKKITDRIPQKLGLKKITRNDPEYWGLAGVLTDEEAELAVKLGVRKPKTLAEIVKLSGLEEKKCEALLEEMSRKGLLEYNWENPKHEKQYVLPMYVPGCAEFFNMNANILDSNPEMGTFFEHMSRQPLEKITPFVPEGGAGIGMHVIPVEKAIEMENESVDLEHISHWLNKYEGKYAASPCSCRRSRLTHGEGCADDPEGWCIAVGDMADYVVETQKDGRYIDKAEALEILKAAEDNGFVHQITNIDGANKIFAICICNVNFCFSLRSSIKIFVLHHLPLNILFSSAVPVFRSPYDYIYILICLLTFCFCFLKFYFIFRSFFSFFLTPCRKFVYVSYYRRKLFHCCRKSLYSVYIYFSVRIYLFFVS